MWKTCSSGYAAVGWLELHVGRAKSNQGKVNFDPQRSIEALANWLVVNRGASQGSPSEVAYLHVGAHDAASGMCEREKCNGVAQAILSINDFLLQRKAKERIAFDEAAYKAQLGLISLDKAIRDFEPVAKRLHDAARAIGPAAIHEHDLLCERPKRIAKLLGCVLENTLALLNELDGFGDELLETNTPNFHLRRWQPRPAWLHRAVVQFLTDDGMEDAEIAKLTIHDKRTPARAVEVIRRLRKPKRKDGKRRIVDPHERMLAPILRHKMPPR